MKQANLKITAKNVKKVKPLAKRVILQSSKENSKPSPPPSPARGEGGLLSLIWERISAKGVNPRLISLGLRCASGAMVRVFNFKRWHKLSAAFVSIAVIGIVVFFQFAPEKARKAWAPAVALAVILTANFYRAIIKSVNPPRATERSCGVFICSLYSYNNG